MNDPLVWLRGAIAVLPEDAGVIVEDDLGYKWELVRAFAIGTSTTDPGLVLKIRPWHQSLRAPAEAVPSE